VVGGQWPVGARGAASFFSWANFDFCTFFRHLMFRIELAVGGDGISFQMSAFGQEDHQAFFSRLIVC
jgi:hypothetical protein